MARWKIFLAAVLGLLLVALGPTALRVVPRWRLLRKFQDSPELSVTPEAVLRLAPPEEPSTPVDIGYAGFALPSGLECSLKSAEDGGGVIIEAGCLSLRLPAPADEDISGLVKWLQALENMGRGRSDNRRLFNTEDGDPASINIVDLQLLAVEAEPPSYGALITMDDEEFKARMIRLTMKTMLCRPAERIVPFEGPHTLGLLYIRKEGTRGEIALTTHDRSLSQTILFARDDPGDVFDAPALSAFLATYRFTVDYYPQPEELEQMIMASDIGRRRAGAEDVPDDGRD